ncbi:hypothetical protein IW140_006609 [Coemansia sp. RSA 1813]|nr:hypothetical protein LPJ74_006665 [Coemansia sp. RSA 1843]KAJ2084889.1 hypothetical protein IW138_006555 [Coemansia sp. RSA 986]KAJ2209981.1 hypothetical protein EV179_006478 [Coemansia sp. RSA 487]KAJ2561095.1 hypothetical protein IW140_006609 [Coemansia sp. RSA 1813]
MNGGRLLCGQRQNLKIEQRARESIGASRLGRRDWPCRVVPSIPIDFCTPAGATAPVCRTCFWRGQRQMAGATAASDCASVCCLLSAGLLARAYVCGRRPKRRAKAHWLRAGSGHCAARCRTSSARLWRKQRLLLRRVIPQCLRKRQRTCVYTRLPARGPKAAAVPAADGEDRLAQRKGPARLEERFA